MFNKQKKAVICFIAPHYCATEPVISNPRFLADSTTQAPENNSGLGTGWTWQGFIYQNPLLFVVAIVVVVVGEFFGCFFFF